MLDSVNQQIAERSLTLRCHRSPTGPPQLEVRKHLRCTNDCKACTHPSCRGMPHTRWRSNREKRWTPSRQKLDTRYQSTCYFSCEGFLVWAKKKKKNRDRHAFQLNFSYVQVNALMEPFHILLMWQSCMRVRLLLSIAAPLWMRNPIFVAPSSLVKLTIALALVNGFIFCCPFALYRWKAADFLWLKATRLPGWKLEFSGDQRSPISPARGKVAAFQSELRRMNITEMFEDVFSHNISLWWHFHKKCLYSATQRCATNTHLWPLQHLLRAGLLSSLLCQFRPRRWWKVCQRGRRRQTADINRQTLLHSTLAFLF